MMNFLGVLFVFLISKLYICNVVKQQTLFTMKESFAQFLAFLTSRHLLDAYFSEIAPIRSDAFMPESFLISLFNGDPDEYISNAFSWSDSSQGFEFWNSLNGQWNSFLSKNL